MKRITVKSRQRHGTESLDLTLPSKIRKKYNFSDGDIFEVKVVEKNEKVEIIYRALLIQNKP